MNKKLVNYNIIILLVLLISCTGKTIYLQLPYVGNKLVINSLLKANEKPEVFVSRTQNVVGERDLNSKITDALVLLLENNIIVDTLQHEIFGKYVSKENYKIIVGGRYTIKVKHKELSAESKQIIVPSNKLEYKIIHYEDSVGKTNSNDPQDYVLSKLDSTTTTSYEFVGLDIETKFKSKGSSSSWQNNPKLLPDTKLCIAGGRLFEDRNNAYVYLFKVSCLPYSSYQIGYFVEKSIANNEKAESIILRFYVFEETYTKYLLEGQQPDPSLLSFEEPHPTFTNIINGYGIVGAANFKQTELKVNCKKCVK